ncbi:hypothetical protein ACFTZK_34015 [Streptomyces decoyicus]|uniref:hypothetical protein n=1 Tax=Streptomyces decoyicus TaxID=249567 RepID=UPI00362C9310
MGIRHRIAPLAAVLALAGGLVATEAAPALAARPASGQTTKTAASDGTYLYFDKNQTNPAESTLSLMKRVPDARDTVLATYRAGSGDGGPHGKDECASSQGWLPNGTYQVLAHDAHYNGGDQGINGHVIHVQDKVCENGRTIRAELFVHSEMWPEGSQASAQPGKDNPYRWDGSGDYRSLGCIKLSPAHIKNLFAKAERYGWPTKLKVAG